MNKFINKYGFLLHNFPKKIVYGSSYAHSQKLDIQYENSNDKIDFIKSFQEKSLKKILSMGRDSTKFYKDYSLTLEQNDFISKRIMQARFSEFLISKTKADFITTGGTSGKPFGFYINKNRKGTEWYNMTSNWSRVGYRLHNSCRAVLRNHIVSEDTPYIYNSFLNEVIFSNYNLNDKKLSKIVTVLIEKRIEFIHAYPSAAYTLSKYLKNNEIKLPYLKVFLSSSEAVYPFQRELIEEELGYRLFTWYGHSEKLVLAAECEYTSDYHANPFYGFMELIDENGKVLSKAGSIGEIVGTGFINTRMPFIRYRTGDFAEYLGNKCSKCGRIGLVFRKVKGRWCGEKIYSKTKTSVTTTALNMHSNLYRNIKSIQYYQKKFGQLIIRIIPEDRYSINDKKKIIQELTKKLGSGFDIHLELVKEIIYTSNNKYKLLIQELKIEENLSNETGCTEF